MRSSILSLVTAFVVFPLSAATIDVRVTDAGGASVQDAVVYAVPDTPQPIGHVVVQMDQKNRVFVPHVLPVQTGTWVEFPNSDNIRHQVYSVSGAKRFQLPLYIGKPAFPIQFSTPGVVLLGCNIHEDMNAFIVVVDTPYFATTPAGGQASLRDLAAGRYTLKVWYPGMRQEPKPVPVTLAEADRQAITVVAK